MTSQVYAEIVKLRRSTLLWLAGLGALAPVVLNVLWYYGIPGRPGMAPASYVTRGLLVLTLLEGPAGAAIISSMLFGREQSERTLPNLLVLPVPRAAWVMAKWAVLALLSFGIVLAAWGLTLVSLALIMGTRALTAPLVIGSIEAFLAAAAALYATAGIGVTLTLAARNSMVGAGWGVAATMVNVVGINSKYGILFPGSIPFVATGLVLEATALNVGAGSLNAQYAWIGLPAAVTVVLVSLLVWALCVAFSLWHVRSTDFA